MDKFAEAFPLSEELGATFLAKEDFDALSADEQKAKEEEALKSVVSALDTMVEWKAHFPEAVSNAISVLARAVGYGAPADPVEEADEDNQEAHGPATKALENALGKLKALISSFSEAAGMLEEQLASKMLRAAKGEAVEFDEVVIELPTEEDKTATVPAAEFIALLKEATEEVLKEGVEDGA